MKIPHFRGHPEWREDARGVFDGEATDTTGQASFTAEFKAEAVRLCKVGDRSIRRVAQDLDLTETALREWVQRAEEAAGKASPESLTTTEQDELRELRKRVKRLEGWRV